jgi:hypothetical protein
MSGMSVKLETDYGTGGVYDGAYWGGPSSAPTAECPYQLLPRDTGIWLYMNMSAGMVGLFTVPHSLTHNNNITNYIAQLQAPSPITLSP